MTLCTFNRIIEEVHPGTPELPNDRFLNKFKVPGVYFLLLSRVFIRKWLITSITLVNYCTQRPISTHQSLLQFTG